MMKKYPALRIVSILYRLFAFLVALALLGMGVADGTLGGMLAASLSALVAGISLYAVGELLVLVIDLAQTMRVSSEILGRMYLSQKKRGTGKERRHAA